MEALNSFNVTLNQNGLLYLDDSKLQALVPDSNNVSMKKSQDVLGLAGGNITQDLGLHDTGNTLLDKATDLLANVGNNTMGFGPFMEGETDFGPGDYNDMDYYSDIPEMVGGMFSERDFLPPPLSVGVKATFLTLYILIMALSVFGNITVISVMTLVAKLRTVTNTFLVSLAVSDLLIAIVNMPIQLAYLLQNEWTLGEPACKFVNFVQGVTVVVSIFTLTGISIHR